MSPTPPGRLGDARISTCPSRVAASAPAALRVVALPKTPEGGVPVRARWPTHDGGRDQEPGDAAGMRRRPLAGELAPGRTSVRGSSQPRSSTTCGRNRRRPARIDTRPSPGSIATQCVCPAKRPNLPCAPFASATGARVHATRVATLTVRARIGKTEAKLRSFRIVAGRRVALSSMYRSNV